MRCVFGIDASKDSISVAIVIDQTMFKETKLPLNRDGFRKLEEALQSFNNPEVVFEATGVYSRRLQRFLDDLGQDYTCLNPLVAKNSLMVCARIKLTVMMPDTLPKLNSL